jgi:murein DD-endopeptidase MepM/ murein hydrolase activator NlpD
VNGQPDAASRRKPARGSAPKLIIALLALTAVGVHVSGRVISARASRPLRLAPTLRYHPLHAHLFSPDALGVQRLENLPLPLESTLRSGETLTTLLLDAGVEAPEAYRAATAAAVLTDLKKLRAGDAYTVFYDGDAAVAVHLAIGAEGRLELERGAPSWQGAFRAFDRRVELRAIQGELDGVLETAIERAGGDVSLAYAMADVLQWDLDFNRDLRLGDTFEVLYERVFLDDRYHAVGRVLALGYESGERRLSAYLFGDGGDYYDAEGRPLQKMFLRSPMRYTRVTSGFSNRRLHPILGTYRPHYGVDYAAPRGTPVRVTATGVVASAGWESGGGRVVRVRHPNGYLTAYLHLSGFADGIRSGARVRQGQVIGFVGATGLATAPHLDYRVRLAERWIDPLSLPNEPAPPIPPERLGEFFAWRDALELGLKEGEARPEVLMAVRLEGGGAEAGVGR